MNKKMPRDRMHPALFLPSIILLIVSLTFLDSRTIALLIPSLLVLPFFIASILQRPPRKEDVGKIIERESAELVALLSVELHRGGTLESAMEFVSETDGLRSAGYMRRILWEVETRIRPNVSEGLLSLISENHVDHSTSMAIQLLMAAATAAPGDERTDLIEEANRIAVDGMRSTMERYAASLNLPGMTVFAVGVVLPLICISLLPMMALGESMNISGGYNILAMAGMLVLPLLVAIYIHSVLAKSPMPQRKVISLRSMGSFIAGSVFVIVLHVGGIDPVPALVLGLSPACLIAYIVTKKEHDRSLKRVDMDDAMLENLVRLGSSIRSGKDLEGALRSNPPQGEAGALTASFLSSLENSRLSWNEALRQIFWELPSSTVALYRAIFRSANKDSVEAGMLSIRMGKYMHQCRNVREDVMNRMRSLTDMMSGTSTVFAPLVLGMGLSLGSPLGGQSVDHWTILLTGLYLVELSALTSWISSSLKDLDGKETVAHLMSLHLPITITVFIISWWALSMGVW